MDTPFTISSRGVADVETIVEHRRAMFSDMGHTDAAVLDRMSAAFRPWVAGKLQTGEYLAWFAVAEGGAIAAGLGLWLMEWLPHLIGTESPRGNIVNVYTEPAYRRHGMARALMGVALDWCRANGIVYVILHASAEGRPLYEEMGFGATNEMRLLL